MHLLMHIHALFQIPRIQPSKLEPLLVILSKVTSMGPAISEKNFEISSQGITVDFMSRELIT